MSTQEALISLSDEVELVDGQLAAVPYIGSIQSTKIIFPQYVYIRDGSGRYLTIRSNPANATLTFRSGEPDPDCIFEAIRTSALLYRFRGRAGGYFTRHADPVRWYSSHGINTLLFNAITASGAIVYLKDNYNPSRFFSSELRPSGSPLAQEFISDSCKMEIIQAALINEISDVQYDILGGKVTELPPLVVFTSSLRNDSDFNVQQTISFSYQNWLVGTWNNVAGRELGTKATFTAGVPFIVNTSFEISVGPPSEQQWAGEEGVKQTVSSSVAVIIPAKMKGALTITVKNVHMEIPFSYRQKITWANGQTQDRKDDGIYNNVDALLPDVMLKWEDI